MIFKPTKTAHARTVASLLLGVLSIGTGTAPGLTAGKTAKATTTPKPAAQKPTAAQVETADQALKQGNALAEKQRYKEASVHYERALAILPKDPSILWNAALSAYQSNNYQRSLALWQRLKTIEPNDGQVRAKLIQTYEALSLLKERNAERKALFTLRKSGKDPELAEKEDYCRDQFKAGGRDVFAYELFELSGERALRYRFLVLKADGTVDHVLSMGSYELTTQYAREAGHITEDERLFHLDGYYDKGRTHRTYDMYTKEPTYGETKAAVIQILTGKKGAISSSRRPAD